MNEHSLLNVEKVKETDYTIYVIVVVVVVIIGYLIYRRILRPQTPFPITTPGWVFLDYLTTGFTPGSLYRKENNVMQHVDLLKVNIIPQPEQYPERERETDTSIGMILKILGVADIKTDINTSVKTEIKFKVANPVGEITYDSDIDQALYEYFSEVPFKKDNRYFIVREAKKTRKIVYTIKKDVIDNISLDVKIKDKLDAGGKLIENRDGTSFNLSLDSLEEPMRFMYKPEEIFEEEVVGPAKWKAEDDNVRYTRKAISDPLEWVNVEQPSY